MSFNSEILAKLFDDINSVTIGIIGDFCLDLHLQADMRLSELSRETPHFPLPIVEERMSAGAAGNVALNAAALKPKKVIAIGTVGNDWRGTLLTSILKDNGVEVSGLIKSDKQITNAYIKPLRGGISETIYEDPRIDFENRTPMPESVEEQLIAALDSVTEKLDVLCVCDQLVYGCISEAVRERIISLGEKGLTVIADSRDRINLYKNVIVKPNEVEVNRAFNIPVDTSFENLKVLAVRLSKLTGRDALITAGKNGCIVSRGENAIHMKPPYVEPPIDICGAGDSFLASFALALAANGDIITAANFANLASSVIIKKINMTGTASREELFAAACIE